MTNTVEYALSEIRQGFVLLVNNENLTVESVTLRRGRGVELFTRRSDDSSGPTLTPHPDEPLDVLIAVPLIQEDLDYLAVCTTDYPWVDVEVGH